MATEVIVPELKIVFESAEMSEIKSYKTLPNGHLEFEGVLQTVDEINRNTNNYPADVLLEALAHPRIADQVARRCWFGEHSHPWDRKNFNRSIDILPDNISHRICQVPYLRGKKLVSIIRTVEPAGKKVVSWIVDEGSQLGFSMRGVTPYSITKTTPFKHSVIKSPMSILTYDIVFFPSHPDALMELNNSLVTARVEGALNLDEICGFIAEESASFKMFKNELGIDLKRGAPITRRSQNTVGVQLEDGRLAELTLEKNILSEIGKHLL